MNELLFSMSNIIAAACTAAIVILTILVFVIVEKIKDKIKK